MLRKKKEEVILKNEGLLASITPIGLEFQHNKIMLGEDYCRVYGIVKYPNEVDYGWYAKLTNIPSTIVSIGFEAIDNGEFIHSLSKNINMYRGAEMSSKDPLERQRKAKSALDGEKIMQQIDQKNESVGNFCTEIMVLSRDEDDFAEKCARTESIANSLGCKIRILSNVQKEAYMHLSPTYGFVKSISEKINRPYLISTFIGGFPFASSGFNDNTGFYLGKNNDGGIILFDLWIRDKSRTNSNITITGKSGMGKSTIIKHIILSEYARGTKIIIIDPEGEYREMCLSENIKGNWIDVAGGCGGIINPLQIRPAPREDDDEQKEETAEEIKKESGLGDLAIHLKTLATFFKLYKPDLTNRHEAILEQLLIEVYDKFGITWDTDISKFTNKMFPIISDLHNLCKSKALQDSSYKEIYGDLVLLLDSAANGADKGLWNGATTVSDNFDFACLDTKAVTQMGSNILAAQYFNVLSWCWQQLSKNRNERVMLVADESWMMIDPKCPQSLEFLKRVEKRVRKYEGSLVVATQSIVDFLDPSIKLCGQAVLNLPSIKFILGADGEDLRDINTIFSLNEAQYDLIASQQRGVALMKVGSQAVKVKFTFTDDRLALFGSGGGR